MYKIKGIIYLFCLIIFFSYTYHSYNEFKKEKSKNTEFFLKNLKVREDDFYKDDDYREEVISNIKEDVIKKDSSSENTEQKKKFYYLQVGTFHNKENAENLKNSLNNIAIFKIINSPHNNKYYLLISEDYSKEKVNAINENIKKKYDSLTPIIKVRY